MGNTWVHVCVLLLVLLKTADCQTYNPYDCRRANSQCATGTSCTRGTGTNANICNCQSTGRVSFNCGLLSSEIISGVCPILCSNGGTCYREVTGVARCFCPAGFSGSNCQDARVRVLACTPSFLTGLINPNSNTFQGKIYVKGHSGTVGCEFQPSADSQNPGYVLQLSLANSGTCAPGALTVTPSADGSTMEWKYIVIVQHNRALISFTDEQHELTCSGSPSGASSVNLGNIDTTNTGGNLGGTTSSGNYNPMAMSFTSYPNQTPLNGPVVLGQLLYIQATPNNIATTPFYRMKTCTASGSNGGVSIQLLANSCITEAGSSAGVFSLTKTGDTILLALYAFKFEADPSIIISCDFNVCPLASDANCNPVSCPDGTFGVGRRKRDVNNSTKVAEASQKLYVVLSYKELEDLLDNKKEATLVKESTCFNTTFIIVVSLVGILLFITLLLLVMVCVRLHKGTTKKEVTSYVNDSVSHTNM